MGSGQKRKKYFPKKRRQKAGPAPKRFFLFSLFLNVCFLGLVAWGLFRGDLRQIIWPEKPQPVTEVKPREDRKPEVVPAPVSVIKLFERERKLSPDKPKLVFVIDDIGHSRQNEALFEELGSRLTYAILPFLPYSKHFAQLSRKTKSEVILHLPLEASDGTYPGPGLITTQMSRENVLDLLERNLSTVPYHVGANSHMGSLGTTDYNSMKIILTEFKRRKLFFLDSYTTAKSVVGAVAQEVGVPVLKRDVFLDNVDEPGAIREQVRQLARQAKAHGYAIGIGHDRHHTLQVIRDSILLLEDEGYEIVSLRELLRFLSLSKRVF